MSNTFVAKMDGEDTALVNVKFANGAIGQIFTGEGFAFPANDAKFHAIGERGEIYSNRYDLYSKPRGFAEPSHQCVGGRERKQLPHQAGLACQPLRRGADPTALGVTQQRRQAGRTGKSNADGMLDAELAQARDPSQHRLGVEAKLRDDVNGDSGGLRRPDRAPHDTYPHFRPVWQAWPGIKTEVPANKCLSGSGAQRNLHSIFSQSSIALQLPTGIVGALRHATKDTGRKEKSSCP